MKTTLLSTIALVSTAFVSTTANADDWEFTIAPYVWGADVRTSLEIGRNQPVDGSTSIFNILNGAFMIAGDARNGRWSIGAEFNYLDLGDDVSVGPFNAVASWELDGTMSSLVGGYALSEKSDSRLEAFGGLRHWDLNLSTTVVNRTASASRVWTDPIIGARFHKSINPRWNAMAMGNIGGFGVGSDFQWEAIVQASWQWTDNIMLAGGYRHLSVDFKEAGDVVDLIFTGPYVALGYEF